MYLDCSGLWKNFTRSSLPINQLHWFCPWQPSIRRNSRLFYPLDSSSGSGTLPGNVQFSWNETEPQARKQPKQWSVSTARLSSTAWTRNSMNPRSLHQRQQNNSIHITWALETLGTPYYQHLCIGFGQDLHAPIFGSRPNLHIIIFVTPKEFSHLTSRPISSQLSHTCTHQHSLLIQHHHVLSTQRVFCYLLTGF